MGTLKWRTFTLISFYLFFTTLFTCNHSAISQAADICKVAFCGMGTCHSTGVIGYRCDCDHAWKKVHIGPIEIPPCVIPNCTLDLEKCGGPLPKAPPLFNISDPCVVNFCGDGKCKANNGLFDFTCQCNEGSANLLKNPKLPCFKRCTIGADCPDLELDFGSPSNPTSPPPPPQNSASPKTWFGAGEFHILAMMILATIFLDKI